MQRFDITRKEFKDQTGHNPDPDTIGLLVIGPTGQPVREYVFIDPVYPPSSRKQITELERLLQL